jgi:putative transposase
MRDLANERNIEYRRLFVLLRHEGDPWASTASRGLFAKMALRRPGDGLGGAPWDRGRRSWLISRGTVGGQWIFVHDRFACGRRFRILNAGDDVTQECLAAIPGTSISGGRMARQVKHDRLRQWNHVHLGAGRQDRLAFDPPRAR